MHETVDCFISNLNQFRAYIIKLMGHINALRSYINNFSNSDCCIILHPLVFNYFDWFISATVNVPSLSVSPPAANT